MKQKKNLWILIGIFVIVLVLAGAAYQFLSPELQGRRHPLMKKRLLNRKPLPKLETPLKRKKLPLKALPLHQNLRRSLLIWLRISQFMMQMEVKLPSPVCLASRRS